MLSLCLWEMAPRAGREHQEVKVYFIATRQDPADDGDTFHAAKICRGFVELAYPAIKADTKTIPANPEDYDGMLQWFTEEITPLARDPKDRIFLHIAAGTPAMSFAAAVTVGQFDKVTTLYTARPDNRQAQLREQQFKSTVDVTSGRDLAKERTHKVAAAALDPGSLNPGDLRAHLEQSPGAGLDDQVKQGLVHALSAWEEWERYHHTKALDHIKKLPSGVLDRPLQDQLLQHLLLLKQTDEQPEHNIPAFWQARLWDNALRADLAARRQDSQPLLMAMGNFKEVAPLYRLSKLPATEKMVYNREEEWNKRTDDNLADWGNRFSLLRDCYSNRQRGKINEIQELVDYCRESRSTAYFYQIVTDTSRKEYLAGILENEIGQSGVLTRLPGVFYPRKRPLGNLWHLYNNLKHNTGEIPPKKFDPPFKTDDGRGQWALAWFLVFMAEKGTALGTYTNPWLQVREAVLQALGPSAPSACLPLPELLGDQDKTGLEKLFPSWLK